MKDSVKIFIILVVVILIANLCGSCTSNQRAKEWGGTMTINVHPNYKVTMATFKGDADMWYMIEPMEDDYAPKDKILIEDPTWGVFHGKVIFHESRTENPQEIVSLDKSMVKAVLDSIPNTKTIKAKSEHRQ